MTSFLKKKCNLENYWWCIVYKALGSLFTNKITGCIRDKVIILRDFNTPENGLPF